MKQLCNNCTLIGILRMQKTTTNKKRKISAKRNEGQIKVTGFSQSMYVYEIPLSNVDRGFNFSCSKSAIIAYISWRLSKPKLEDKKNINRKSLRKV